MCKRETFKQLAGEQCKVICGAWASKHTYITVIYYSQSFVGLWTHNGVWKCLVRVEESVLLQVACDFHVPETWCYWHFLCMFASSRLIALCTPNCKSLWIKASAKWLNVNVNILANAAFIWSKNCINSNAVKYQYDLIMQLFYILIYLKYISCESKAEFSAAIISEFSITWFFGNHYNMLTCCSRNIYFYYQS